MLFNIQKYYTAKPWLSVIRILTLWFSRSNLCPQNKCYLLLLCLKTFWNFMPNFINFLSVILINYNQQPGDICVPCLHLIVEFGMVHSIGYCISNICTKMQPISKIASQSILYRFLWKFHQHVSHMDSLFRRFRMCLK